MRSSFILLGSSGGEVAPEKNKNSESLNKEIDKFKYIKFKFCHVIKETILKVKRQL